MLSFEFYIQFHVEIIHTFLPANYILLSLAKDNRKTSMAAIIAIEEAPQIDILKYE